MQAWGKHASRNCRALKFYRLFESRFQLSIFTGAAICQGLFPGRAIYQNGRGHVFERNAKVHRDDEFSRANGPSFSPPATRPDRRPDRARAEVADFLVILLLGEIVGENFAPPRTLRVSDRVEITVKEKRRPEATLARSRAMDFEDGGGGNDDVCATACVL